MAYKADQYRGKIPLTPANQVLAMQLVKIAQGWYQFKKGAPEVRQRMLRRLQVCDACPNKVQADGAGQVLSLVLGNSPENFFSCKLCGCPLGALASLAKPECRLGSWNQL